MSDAFWWSVLVVEWVLIVAVLAFIVAVFRASR